MKSRFFKFKVLPLGLVLAAMAVTGMQIVNARQDRPLPPNPLTFLRHALEEASAPALTTQQEEQLTALITAFHEARRSQIPNESVRVAHESYDAAILAGNEGTAQAQAAAFANVLAAQTAARLKEETTFKINALEILSSAQKAAIGEELLPKILNRLAGGPLGPVGPGRGLRPGGPDGLSIPPGMRRRPN